MHVLEVILDGTFSAPPSGRQGIREVTCGALDAGRHFSVRKILDSGAFWALCFCTGKTPLVDVSNQRSLWSAGPSPASHARHASDFKMKFVCQSILLRTAFRNTQGV